MLISMLVNHMKVRVKYAYMLNKSSLDMIFVVSEFDPSGMLCKWFCVL